MKLDLFGGLYWGSMNCFAHWERSSLILAQPCESEVVEAYRLWKVQLKIQYKSLTKLYSDILEETASFS